jgi:BatD DUF11 like domain
MSPKFWIFFSFLLLTLSAQATTVRAFIQPPNMRPNQVVQYVISVEGENGASINGVPELQLPLQIQQASGVSTSQQYQIINGQTSATTTFTWGIVASEPGEFVIPAQTVQVNGESKITNEVKVTVGQGGAAPAEEDPNLPLLQIELGKKEIYQGEVLPISGTLYVPRQTPVRRFGLIELDKSDLAIARFPQQPEQGLSIIGGVGYQTFTFRSTLSALKAGEVQVGPAKQEIIIEVETNDPNSGLPPGFPPGFRNRGFFSMSEPRKMTIKSPPVKLNVLPLPSEGRPANFSGAVGDFTLSATATPTELTVGDPISAEVMIAGSGNFDALTPPALSAPAGWKLYPPRRYSIEGQMSQNEMATAERKIGYSMVLVAEAVQKEVPSFEISFFSPTQKKYVNLRTQAIPLNMKPAAPLAESGASSGSSPSQPAADLPPPAADPQVNITDIVIRPPAQSRWAQPAGTALWSSPVFWGLQAIPVGLFAAACLTASFRRRREAYSKTRNSQLRSALAQLESGQLTDHEFLRGAVRLLEQLGSPQSDILARYAEQGFSAAPTSTLSSSERLGMLQKVRSILQTAVLALMLIFSFSAVQAASSPDEVYTQAVTEVEKGQFPRAQHLLEGLAKKTPPVLSAESCQIIGHARYRAKDYGRAALWYQRAQLLDSAQNPELRQNLSHIQNTTRYHQPAPFGFWERCSLRYSRNIWLLLAAVGLWIVLLYFSAKLFFRLRTPGWLTTLVLFVGLDLGFCNALMAWYRPELAERVKSVQVVTQADLDLYTAATSTAGSVISLPPGSQVKQLEVRGSWQYVEVKSRAEDSAETAYRGWVPTSAVSPLWPWETQWLPQ